MSNLGHLKYHLHVASKSRGVKGLKLCVKVTSSLPNRGPDLICREWLSPLPLSLAHSTYPGYTWSSHRASGEGSAPRISRSLVLPKPACGAGTTCLQAILLFTVVSGRYGLKETSQGPMGIGSLVPEKATDAPAAYHSQHTLQGGFCIVTGVEATGQVPG